MKQSMSCLRGQLDVPKPLYQRDENEINLGRDTLAQIGKARLVSASPYRASVKMDKNNIGADLNQNSDDEDDFDRDELPELVKTRESPIKDDSELLRHQKTDFLTNFSGNNQRKNEGGIETMTNRSERTPNLASGDLKGIMIRDTTRTSFEKQRNSAAVVG